MLVMIGLMMCGLSAVATSTGESEDPSAARSVVDRYFDALSRGDVDALRDLLGGRMWERMSRRMVNPNYSDFLQENYATTRHSIEDTRTLDEGGVEVVVEVSFPDAEAEAYRLVLRRDREADPYRIIAEY